MPGGGPGIGLLQQRQSDRLVGAELGGGELGRILCVDKAAAADTADQCSPVLRAPRERVCVRGLERRVSEWAESAAGAARTLP